MGVSGTPQHLAGVSVDSRIIAVNKDPGAAIFAHAEVGVVAEWQALLPLLIQELDAAIG
ncbi:Electron transfer flavoprotein subunit alpha [compost metagenome]